LRAKPREEKKSRKKVPKEIKPAEEQKQLTVETTEIEKLEGELSDIEAQLKSLQ
jgi:hypothetical protein